MNVAVLTTIETILDETEPADAADYREHGRRAAQRAREYPDIVLAVLAEAMTAKARQRAARGKARTRDGLATVVADAATGQMTVWRDSIDADWLRETGRRLVAEGDRKMRLGQLMQQAADCVEAHPGMTARDAWQAEGWDTATLDAAGDEAIAL